MVGVAVAEAVVKVLVGIVVELLDTEEVVEAVEVLDALLDFLSSAHKIRSR